jgi:ribosomal protein L7/L12
MTVGGQSGEVIPRDVILRDAGASPAAVAEAVRAMTGLEAPAAAELVARTPSAIRTRIAPALAEALRAKLVAAGATVELRPHDAAPAPGFFDVYLQDRGDSKISVVRALKMMMGLGLREAVELVDDAPCLVRRRVPQDEAEALRHELVEAGAVVEVRAHESSAPPERTASGEAAVTWGAATSEPTPTRASEPTTGFAVVLHHFGTRKLDVIKQIRDFAGLALKDAKDLAESTDVVLKQGMSEPEARVFAQALAGVEARVSVRGAPAAAPSASSGSGTGFEVVLHHFGTRKIDVIKLIREATGLGLKEAKDLSESTDAVLKSGMREDEAQRFARALAAVDARVSVRGAPAPAPERSNLPEPTVGYGVVLRSCGSNKISVIKLIREATALGLKEAKDLAESTDVMIKDGLSGGEAQALAQSLTAMGARVEVRSPAWAADPAEDLDDGPYSTAPLDVILGACGPQKIAVIKVIREELGCGLKEAKDLSETPGAVLREGIRRAEAEELAHKLTALGAAVELREMWRRAEPAEVDVFLQSHGPNKISVIKEVRALTGLGLKDAKDLVEAAPTLIKQKVELATARQLQAILVEVGAVVELR